MFIYLWHSWIPWNIQHRSQKLYLKWSVKNIYIYFIVSVNSLLFWVSEDIISLQPPDCFYPAVSLGCLWQMNTLTGALHIRFLHTLTKCQIDYMGCFKMSISRTFWNTLLLPSMQQVVIQTACGKWRAAIWL